MCNLYDIGPSRRQARTAFEAAALKLFPELPKSKGIRKTDTGLVVLAEDDRHTAEMMRWGFVRDFNNAINNTRSDKLDSAMWRKAFAGRRCLVPVAAFYEWTGPAVGKQAHRLQSDQPDDWLWVAGIYERHREHGLCYSMITTAAPPWMTHIHQRIIAIFNDLETADAYLRTDDPAALIAPPKDRLQITPCESPLKKTTPKTDGSPRLL